MLLANLSKFLSEDIRVHQFNSLPNDKFLDWSKLKGFADDKINAAEKFEFVLQREENIVGKRRKCWLPAFSPFPTMFSKSCFFRVVKSGLCGKEFSKIYTNLTLC